MAVVGGTFLWDFTYLCWNLTYFMLSSVAAPMHSFDTFSFQARPFYEKLGYRVFGTLENHPSGHQHYLMTKKL